MNECRKAPHSLSDVQKYLVKLSSIEQKNAYRQKLLAAFFTNIWRNLAYCSHISGKAILLFTYLPILFVPSVVFL